MSDKVSIVIVSHSKQIAEGTADMARQMVDDTVLIAYCGGDAAGGLGTNVQQILDTIQQVFSPKGVALLVDLGGAETNSEMAIEMLPETQRGKVVICDAPIVEGAVMAATEASSGSELAVVKETAEDF